MEELIQQLSAELNCPASYVQNVVTLIDEGNTIPFIARYRKELHGGMDDTALRTLADRLTYLRNLAQRRDEITRADLLEQVPRRPRHDGVEERLVVLVRGEHQGLDRRVL